jgi:hypothetical protein
MLTVFTGLLLLCQVNMAQARVYGRDPTHVPAQMVRSTETDPMMTSDAQIVNKDAVRIEQQQQREDLRPVSSNKFVMGMAVVILALLFYFWRTGSKNKLY